jgi:hypothetical protein
VTRGTDPLTRFTGRRGQRANISLRRYFIPITYIISASGFPMIHGPISLSPCFFFVWFAVSEFRPTWADGNFSKRGWGIQEMLLQDYVPDCFTDNANIFLKCNHFY